MWLNYLIDDRHFSYITKMKKRKNPASGSSTKRKIIIIKEKKIKIQLHISWRATAAVGGDRQESKPQNTSALAVFDLSSRRVPHTYTHAPQYVIRKTVFSTLFVLFDLRNEELPESLCSDARWSLEIVKNSVAICEQLLVLYM
jgi:hypothetical protein